MTVVSDTTPLNYLLLIDEVAVLPRLFGQVLLPRPVVEEMRHPKAPLMVREFVDSLPDWAKIVDVGDTHDDALGEGEAAVLFLAKRENCLLLVDEQIARRRARELGISCIGTVGILILAHREGILNFAEAVGSLSSTSFRIDPKLVDELLGQL